MGGSALPPLPPHAGGSALTPYTNESLAIRYPPSLFRKLPILENDWELVCNKNPPNNRRNLAKLFIK